MSQHAERVLRILKLDDLMEGLVYCDYLVKDFVCKPEPEFYQMVGKFLLHVQFVTKFISGYEASQRFRSIQMLFY